MVKSCAQWNLSFIAELDFDWPLRLHTAYVSLPSMAWATGQLFGRHAIPKMAEDFVPVLN
jgi:hypothetical protein